MPPGSAAMRDADAAAAGREVLEMQIGAGGSVPCPSLAAAALGRCSPSLQGLPSYSPAFASLQYTEGRRVVAWALRTRRTILEQQGPGVVWSWGRFASDRNSLANLGDLSCEMPVGTPHH